MRKEFLFSGKGGQGSIFVSIVLAEAALIEGLHAVQSQVYGAAARGEVTKAEVVISDSEILYPRIRKADFYVSFDYKALRNFINEFDMDGVLIFDNTYKNIGRDKFKIAKIYEYPFSKRSIEEFKSTQPMNMMALGFLAGVSKIVKIESIIKSLRIVGKERFFNINEISLKIGYDLSKEVGDD